MDASNFYLLSGDAKVRLISTEFASLIFISILTICLLKSALIYDTTFVLTFGKNIVAKSCAGKQSLK